jgi:hypothetical protein
MNQSKIRITDEVLDAFSDINKAQSRKVRFLKLIPGTCSTALPSVPRTRNGTSLDALTVVARAEFVYLSITSLTSLPPPTSD